MLGVGDKYVGVGDLEGRGEFNNHEGISVFFAAVIEIGLAAAFSSDEAGVAFPPPAQECRKIIGINNIVQVGICHPNKEICLLYIGWTLLVFFSG